MQALLCTVWANFRCFLHLQYENSKWKSSMLLVICSWQSENCNWTSCLLLSNLSTHAWHRCAAANAVRGPITACGCLFHILYVLVSTRDDQKKNPWFQLTQYNYSQHAQDSLITHSYMAWHVSCYITQHSYSILHYYLSVSYQHNKSLCWSFKSCLMRFILDSFHHFRDDFGIGTDPISLLIIFLFFFLLGRRA